VRALPRSWERVAMGAEREVISTRCGDIHPLR
jgi:hypothetical protein